MLLLMELNIHLKGFKMWTPDVFALLFISKHKEMVLSQKYEAGSWKNETVSGMQWR